MVNSETTAIDVSRMFTYAVEKAMSAEKPSVSTKGGSERNRARHEAIAQYMLDYIIADDSELNCMLSELGVSGVRSPVAVTESPAPGDGRFDHEIYEDDGDQFPTRLLIEDKLDAPLAIDQLDRYSDFLRRAGGGKLVILHPRRNSLSREAVRARQLESRSPRVDIEFVEWRDLAGRMISRDKGRAQAGLWRALAEFAETVGTGDLAQLPLAKLLLDPSVAREVQDILMTAQVVASRLVSRSPHQLRFSMNSGNAVPWLQAGLTDNKTYGFGIQLNLESRPGCLEIGSCGPGYEDSRLLFSKMGYFEGGKLSPAAERRLGELERLALDVGAGRKTLPERLEGRRCGKMPSDSASDAIRLLAAIFQSKALRNPYRGGGSDGRTRGANFGELGERVGVNLVRAAEDGAKRAVRINVGPPDEDRWSRCTVWIEGEDGDPREIVPSPRETGREYVLRVWETARAAIEG